MSLQTPPQISLIIPVKNEAQTIRCLLDSIKSQTLQPSEIILVDGGSADHTLDVVKGENIRNCIIVSSPGANIAKSRNIGIQNAKNSLIACTDAGAILDKDWLANIAKPFNNPDIDVVGGFYKPTPGSTLQRIIGALYYPKKNKVGHDFIPSARSIAFKKAVWERVGGFPEHLTKAEDTVFFLKIEESKAKIGWAPDALVYWPPRQSISAFFEQNYSYALNDVIAGIYFKRAGYLKQLLLSAAVVLSLIFFAIIYPTGIVVVLAIYWIVPGVLFANSVKQSAVFLYAPIVLITLMSSTCLGLLSGSFSLLKVKLASRRIF